MAEFEHLYGDMDMYFEELEYVRLSGIINMFAAPAWLRKRFDLNESESKYIFKAWTATYK